MTSFVRLLCVFPCLLASSVLADSWSDQFIDTKKIDFGVIAAGSENFKEVEIRNTTAQTISIRNVGTSCVCAKAEIAADQRRIPPGKTGVVKIQMNTVQFNGRKNSNLLIRIDAPRVVEHRVPITAYIRKDIVLTPGRLKFGQLQYGNAGQAQVKIAYAGRPDWDITDIRFSNKNMRASLSAKQRINGQIHYTLTMNVDEKIQVGKLREMVTIVTNDRTNPYIPVMTEGVIKPDITASPSVLQVGTVPSGEPANVKMVLKGAKEFKVVKVDCEGMAGCFKASIPESPRKLQVIPVQFTPPNRPGKFTEELIVQIEGRPEPLRLNVTGTILN